MEFAGRTFESNAGSVRGPWAWCMPAFDRVNDTMVALKVLNRVDGEALLRFKREFRAVQDLAHPNVVALEDSWRVRAFGSSPWS